MTESGFFCKIGRETLRRAQTLQLPSLSNSWWLVFPSIPAFLSSVLDVPDARYLEAELLGTLALLSCCPVPWSSCYPVLGVPVTRYLGHPPPVPWCSSLPVFHHQVPSIPTAMALPSFYQFSPFPSIAHRHSRSDEATKPLRARV